MFNFLTASALIIVEQLDLSGYCCVLKAPNEYNNRFWSLTRNSKRKTLKHWLTVTDSLGTVTQMLSLVLLRSVHVTVDPKHWSEHGFVWEKLEFSIIFSIRVTEATGYLVIIAVVSLSAHAWDIAKGWTN